MTDGGRLAIAELLSSGYVALKSAQGEPDRSEVIEEALEQVDKTLDRVKTLYEQYFLGIQKQPPAHLHTDCERKLRDLSQLNIRNTGLRYRMATLQQKFGSYNTYWRRTLRQIESGTYHRNLSKIGRQSAASGKAVPEEILAAMPKRMREQVQRDRDAALAMAKLRNQDLPADDDVMALDDADVMEGDDAPANIEEPKQPREMHQSARLKRGGAHVLDEADADVDLDALFAAATNEAGPEIELPTPRVAPAPVAPFRTTVPMPVSTSARQGLPTGMVPRMPTSHLPPVTRAALEAAGVGDGVPHPVDQVGSGEIPVVAGPLTGPVTVITTGYIPRMGQTAMLPRMGQTGTIPTIGPADATARDDVSTPAGGVVAVPQASAPLPGVAPTAPAGAAAGARTPASGIPSRASTPHTGVHGLTRAMPVIRYASSSESGPASASTPVPAPAGTRTAAGVPAAPSQAQPFAPSQGARPNPIAPGSSSGKSTPVETMSGPFPRAPVPASSPVPSSIPVRAAPPRPDRSEKPATPERPPAGMTDADVNALYAKYVKAKAMVGETAGPGAYGKLLKTIKAQAPKIMEQYNAKAVDFSVVVKDNQVIIRAKPKH